jgi:hypothetical protein
MRTFGGADLGWADFRGADLSGANLSRANLGTTNFAGCRMAQTVVADVDLSTATGLRSERSSQNSVDPWHARPAIEPPMVNTQAVPACSLTTLRGFLSSRSPTNFECRNLPSTVHSRNSI